MFNTQTNLIQDGEPSDLFVALDRSERVRAVRTRPEQILVCGGFAQGLSVICRVLRLRGMSQLAVEEPCFSFHRRIITAAGLEPVPIAVDQAGLEVAQLGLTRAHAVLLSPAHSYPTGAVMSPERRMQLVRWARQRDALVIEDDYDAELRYDRTPVGAIQGLAPEHVIYGGSASKMLSPAFAHELQQRGLADPGLAAQHQHRAPPLADALQQPGQRGALIAAAAQHHG